MALRICLHIFEAILKKSHRRINDFIRCDPTGGLSPKIILGRNKRLNKTKTCVHVLHFSFEGFNQTALPRSLTKMLTLNHMFCFFDVFAQETLVGVIHADTMNLVECWNNIVTNFCKKNI